MTKQKPQQDWEKAIRDILPKSGCTATYDEDCYYHDAHKPSFWDDEVNKLTNLISTERTKILNEIREMIEGMKIKWVEVKNKEQIIRKEAFIRIFNTKLDSLLQALNKLQGG